MRRFTVPVRHAMTLRQAKWLRCKWRHEIMSPEYERRLTAYIAAWRRRLEPEAWRMSRGNRQLADELVQRGLIGLWTLGVDRLDVVGEGYVWTVVKREMLKELRLELCGMMRNGDRLLG